MENKFLLLIINITIFSAAFSSCKKADDPVPPTPEIENPFNGKTTAVFNSDVIYDSIADIDGNVYKTVTIGTQIWMAENLRTTKYNDGGPISNEMSDFDWGHIAYGAYCNINNTENEDSIATFGRLYNWYAVNTGMLAPIGWHIPSHQEWGILATYLGGNIIAGDKLRETGYTHWLMLNDGATNQSGFTALPCGYRGYSGDFAGNIQTTNNWWSSSLTEQYNNKWAWVWSTPVYYYDFSFDWYYSDKRCGFSVRCVKD